MNRRSFLKSACSVAAVSYAAPGIRQCVAQAHTASGRAYLDLFLYSQVKFAPGPLQTQFDENHAFFLNLNEDRMLKAIRQRVGLPAPGENMGGWYDNYPHPSAENNFHGALPGHSFGQYVSALSRFYAATGDKNTQAKVHRLVREFAKTVEPTGKFWKGYGQAAYTYDKSVCGLLDAHTLAASPDALPALRLATEAVLPYLPDKAETKQEYEERRRREKIETGSYDEAYTLPENQFLAWRATGDPRYRKLATRFVYDQYFDPLSQDHNVLAGKHAYSHVNALSSAVQAYLVLGSPKYLAAAKNGFRMLQEQSFATGGWGPNEFLLDPNRPSIGPRPNDNALFGQSELYGDIGESLIRTHHTFETPCGAYGHFKIARYLLRITHDSSYGDSMERVLYNTVLGVKPIQNDGRSFYYSDYSNDQARKVFYPSEWPCCSGTLPQISADYRISTYFHGPDGIYVNLYAPSTLTWKQGGQNCRLTLATRYPYDSHLQFTVETASPTTFSIYLRIPAWANGATLAVNGKRLETPVPGSFHEIRREWKSGSVIDMDLPFPLSLEPVDRHHPTEMALLRGPLVLFAIDPVTTKLSRKTLLGAKSASADGHIWSVESGQEKIRFRTFPDIKDEPYRTYLSVT